MKFSSYLKDKAYSFIIFIVVFTLLILLLTSFKTSSQAIIAFSLIFITFYLTLLLIDFFRKRNYYTQLIQNVENLDKSYLVLETLNKPTFYEGLILDRALYQINKSMLEQIRIFENQVHNFKDYIEMWIHEIKIPVTSLTLMSYNHKELSDQKTLEQLKKIESYIEQVLFYVRSENAENDYLIKPVNLDQIIANVALKNKNDFFANKIEFISKKNNVQVYTDAKWLEFILGQIINNSIKYHRKIKNSYIKTTINVEEDKTILTIEDNGIGIAEHDIPRIFLKSFTGENGRASSSSTGMGLYISKSLCDKLGHSIYAESKKGQYTRISIEFSNNKYYEVTK